MGVETGTATVFDQATAVTQAGGGRYHVRPDERFAMITADGVPGAVNGGILLATMLRAVLDTSPHPYPVATSAHFLRVPRPEPAQVQVEWLKQGRTAATARATLAQEGERVLETTVTTGMLPARAAPPADGVVAGGVVADGELSWTAPPPRIPPPAECVPVWGAGGFSARTGFTAQVELRLDPATAGWLHGHPAGLPEMRGYFRLREEREPDAYLLALAVDAMPPVVFGLAQVGWSPTVELTWHMRALPAPGLLLIATRCRHVSGGWFDEEAEVWDSAGRLVAQARQIARVGRGQVSGPGAG